MTNEEAVKRVNEIKRIKDDDESAHAMEDELYADFIKDISKQNSETGKIAKTILKTKRISFARWYA